MSRIKSSLHIHADTLEEAHKIAVVSSMFHTDTSPWKAGSIILEENPEGGYEIGPHCIFPTREGEVVYWYFHGAISSISLYTDNGLEVIY